MENEHGISVEGTFIEHEEADEYINLRASFHICSASDCTAPDARGIDGVEQLHLKMVRLVEEFPREAEEQMVVPSKSANHSDLVKEYRALQRQLYQTEMSLYHQERLYIEDVGANSMVKGLESSPATGRFATTPRGRQARIKDKDRIFSTSSCTGGFVDERLPSPSSSPVAKKPKPSGKQKY